MTPRSPLALILPALAAAFLGAGAGCSKKAENPADAIAPAAMLEAKQMFNERCTPCHGRFGKGDGPASAALTPKPRNFGDRSWQSGVTDEHLEKIVVYGGAAVGKSPAMPANPDLDGKPALVKAMRAHLRSLGM